MIIDDERPAREELAFLLSGIEDVEIIGQADSASSAIDTIHAMEPDFIFLDIQLSGRSGFEVLPEIQTMVRPPLVVFITAYDQYAVKAFEENAIDYILKPFSRERLKQSVDRVQHLLRLNTGETLATSHKTLVEKTAQLSKIKKISVERQGRLLLLNPDEIIFCQYKDKKIRVYTEQETYTLYSIQTMDQLETVLEPFSFFRSHRNTIINFNHIREFSPWFHGKYLLTMADHGKTELTIPRDRVKSFKQWLGI